MWLGRVCVVFVLFGASAGGGAGSGGVAGGVAGGLSAEDGGSLIVYTTQGPVRGYKDPDLDIFTFYNIPYATAPTGKDRFKGPMPGPTWMSPFDAVDRGIICPQFDFPGLPVRPEGLNMREDCLVVNVYVPNTKEKNIPVVFLVHGGGYVMGHGNLIEPKKLVSSKRVIVVSFNYRLGIHGFLCLGTSDIPGNAGMKDQVAALRWVNKNIANFGGNPNDVTLEGYSAGSSSVDLLLLSETTKGLFHKAIPESGASVATWSVQLDPLDNAKWYIKEHGYDVDVEDFDALQGFYKTAPFELLTKDIFIDKKNNDFRFTPCIERYTGAERFLDDYPVNILKKAKYSKVPMLYGFSNMEGLLRVGMGYDAWKNGMNERFSDFLPNDLFFKNEAEKEMVAKEVKEYYFGDKAIGDETIKGYVDFVTDVTFAYPHLRALKLQVEAGNDKIYLYEYTYPSEYQVPGTSIKLHGADHCDQTKAILDGYAFLGDNDESKFSDNLTKIKTIMREIWLNFITTGKPYGSALPVEWPPAGADGSPYMELSLTPTLHHQPLLSERMRFWEKLFDKYYRPPVPPPAPPTKHTEL